MSRKQVRKSAYQLGGIVENFKRQVRSFVRREGRITEAQKRAIEQYWPLYGLNIEDGLLDIEKAFGRKAEVVLEIGFGSGHSLCTMAQENPAHDFIGVEVHRPGVGSLLQLMHEKKLSNIRIYQEDVIEVLKHCIPEDSLDKIQLFFPDPWPKKRHHKRRIVSASFVELIHPKLKLGGQIHLATDWENYAQQMMEIFSTKDEFNNIAGHGNYLPKSVSNRPSTKFERRGAKLGHGVWDMIFVKVG